MSHRKPAGRRQNRERSAGARVIAPLLGRAVSGPPPAASRSWSAETRAAWARYWASPVARATDLVDEPAVRRLFELLDERGKAWKRYLQQPESVGSTGQLVVSPWAAFALQLDDRIARLERAFGITPSARAALGIAIGEVRRTLDDLAREAAEHVE